jgi:hypothetical protein
LPEKVNQNMERVETIISRHLKTLTDDLKDFVKHQTTSPALNSDMKEELSDV